jgi:hypothetical protein
MMSRVFVLLPGLAALMIAVALAGTLHPSSAHAQTLATFSAQPQAASSPSGGATIAAASCADLDSWCKYCAQHLGLAACSNYAPGNGIASTTGGVDPSNASQGGACGGS